MLVCCFPCALPKRVVSALNSSICWHCIAISNTIKKKKKSFFKNPPHQQPSSKKMERFCLGCEEIWWAQVLVHQQPASETRWVKSLQSWASSPFSQTRRVCTVCLQIWAEVRKEMLGASCPQPLAFRLAAGLAASSSLQRESVEPGEQQGWRGLQVAGSWACGGCYVRPGHRGVPQAGTQPLGHGFSTRAATCGHKSRASLGRLNSTQPSFCC